MWMAFIGRAAAATGVERLLRTTSSLRLKLLASFPGTYGVHQGITKKQNEI
jgi:hypothetical protein